MDARSRAKETIIVLLIVLCVMYFYFLVFSNTGMIGEDVKCYSTEYFGCVSYIIPAFLSLISIFIYVGWHRKESSISVVLKIFGIIFFFWIRFIIKSGENWSSYSGYGFIHWLSWINNYFIGFNYWRDYLKQPFVLDEINKSSNNEN